VRQSSGSLAVTHLASRPLGNGKDGSDARARITTAVLGITAVCVFFQQRVEDFLGIAEIRSLKPPEGLRQVNQAALRREIKNAQRARYAESFATSHRHALAIIHEQQIGTE
jgi:hypothetical protein